MPLITNGDFSDGLTGWTVFGAGPTAPTFDAANQRVIFGRGNNDVRDGDRLQQQVALEAGKTYTLSFRMIELGAPNGGFGLNIELIGTSGTQFLTFASVDNDEDKIVTVTFTSNFDDPILRIRGGFGFGGVNSALILEYFVLTCFAAGTLITTPGGDVAVEALAVGDRVVTLDHGAQKVRWIGRRQVSGAELRARPEWYPVLPPAQCMRPGAPARGLMVSPCHRILLRGARVQMLVDETEALCPARSLVGAVAGVRVMDRGPDPDGGVTYVHLLFDHHEVLWSEWLETESFHLAARTVSSFERQARAEILALFPELLTMAMPPRQVARPILKAREVPFVLASRMEEQVRG
ncbi:MAG: Hint domain-containing protein [Gemmobacter sp.]